MARITITPDTKIPTLPLGLYESHIIAQANTEAFGECDVVVGLDESIVAQLITRSHDRADEALAQTSDAKRFFDPQSYETWFQNTRTPFALIQRETKALMALVWIGPKPLGKNPPKLYREDDTHIPTNATEIWDTISFRSYPPYRGGGIMTVFVQYVLSVYRDTCPGHHIWATIDEGNVASASLTKKLGFVELPSVSQKGRTIMTLRSDTPKRLYVVDFDGTLFKTEAFWNDFRDMCIKNFSIDTSVFNETQIASRGSDGVYDIDLHLQALSINKSIAREYMETLIKEHSYIFEDATPFFEQHTRDTLLVLTQGVDWYQRVKTTALPSIQSLLDIVTTMKKKREYILEHAHFTDDGVTFDGVHYKSLTFIDNMAQAFIPETQKHPNVHQYRIRRKVEDDKYAPEDTPTHVTEVNALIDI